MSKSKVWFNSFVGKKSSDTVSFFDKRDFDWVNILESNWQLFREEIDGYMIKDFNDIKPYFNSKLTLNNVNRWKSFGLLLWGLKIKKNFREMPKSVNILNQINGIVSASVSILEPGVEIKPHCGDTDAIYRVHLGLKIPEELPNCGIQVGNDKKSWKEGEVIIFNDATIHSAWNLTKEIRYVLIIDVLKEEFFNQKYYICSQVLSKLFLQNILNKLSISPGKISKKGFHVLLKMIAPIINIFLRMKAI
jgi:ornithine lipid ester-linked acyl 2-hydroxylase